MTEVLSQGAPDGEKTLRPFTELRMHEKVQAVIAASLAPLSEELALELAGVSMDDLDDHEKETVQSVFSAGSLQINHNEQNGDQYFVPEDQKERIFQSIGADPASVNRRIVDVLMGAFEEMKAERKSDS